MSDRSNPLATFLEEEGLSQHEFATLVGADVSNVCRWVNGDRKPSAKFAYLMHVKTKGKVPMSFWAEAH